MTDRPIAFSKPMVLALLAGRKTETRRVLKPQPTEWQAQVIDIRAPSQNEDGEWGQVETVWSGPLVPGMCEPDHEEWHPLRGVRFRVGDRLYVREEIEAWVGDGWIKYLRYASDRHQTFHEWPEEWQRDKARPMHMFKRFSRMTLPVIGVRVERLHDITNEGAIAEGIERIPYEGNIPDHIGQYGWKDYRKDHPYSFVPLHHDKAVLSYRSLWESINGEGSWDLNPWVCVTRWSHVIHQNIDQVKS